MLALAIFSLMLLTIIVLVVMIKEKWNPILMSILVPFLLFNVAFSWHTVNDLWGQPKDGLPEDDSFRVVYAKNAKPWIYLLTIEPDVDYPVFRRIPWTKQSQEQLEKGTKAQKEGKRMVAKKSKTPTDADTQIELYEWDAQTAMPKD